MARELITRARCDACGDEAIYVGVPILLGTAIRRTRLDLCDRDYKELVQPLLDLLASPRPYPKTPSRHRQNWKREVGPIRCKAGCKGVPPLKNVTTFETHLARIHDTTLEDYVLRYGILVPATPEELAQVDELGCPIGDCDTVYSTALGNRWPHQAMRNHVLHHHKVPWDPAYLRA